MTTVHSSEFEKVEARPAMDLAAELIIEVLDGNPFLVEADIKDGEQTGFVKIEAATLDRLLRELASPELLESLGYEK